MLKRSKRQQSLQGHFTEIYEMTVRKDKSSDELQKLIRMQCRVRPFHACATATGNARLLKMEMNNQ